MQTYWPSVMQFETRDLELWPERVTEELPALDRIRRAGRGVRLARLRNLLSS